MYMYDVCTTVVTWRLFPIIIILIFFQTTDATRCLTRNISVNCTGAVEDPESFVVEQENVCVRT